MAELSSLEYLPASEAYPAEFNKAERIDMNSIMVGLHKFSQSTGVEWPTPPSTQ